MKNNKLEVATFSIDINSEESNFDKSSDLIPKEIPILPPSPIKGRNGKKYTYNADEFIKTFEQRGVEYPVDINHESELNAPQGHPSPAVAWAKDLFKKEDGSVWGKPNWEEVGQVLIKNKQYRYLSPAVVHSGGNILHVKSIALTNSPNFYLPALNSETIGEIMPKDNEENITSIDIEVLKSLGLPDGASKEEVLQAISTLQDKESKNLNSEDVVKSHVHNMSHMHNSPASNQQFALTPEEMMAEINRLNMVIAELQNSAFADKKSKTLNSFIEKGKITPVSHDFYMRTLNSENSLNDFIETMEKQPSITGGSFKPKSPLEKSLNSEEVAFAKKHGFDEKVFSEAKAKMFNK